MSDGLQMHRDIGRMEAEISALKSQVSTMQKQVSDMHTILMRAQGSWKAIVGAAGFSAAITAAALKVAALFGFGR